MQLFRRTTLVGQGKDWKWRIFRDIYRLSFWSRKNRMLPWPRWMAFLGCRSTSPWQIIIFIKILADGTYWDIIANYAGCWLRSPTFGRLLPYALFLQLRRRVLNYHTAAVECARICFYFLSRRRRRDICSQQFSGGNFCSMLSQHPFYSVVTHLRTFKFQLVICQLQLW